VARVTIACLFAPLVFAVTPVYADSPLPRPTRQEFHSPNRRILVVSDPGDDNTTVYRLDKKGRRKKLWRIDGWAWYIAVTNDGSTLIESGLTDLLSLDYKPSEELFRFVRRGKTIRRVAIEEIVPDASKLRMTTSHYLWGSFGGIDSRGRFVVKALDRTILYDPKTGERIPPK
jgi:hypothetical protein